MFQKIANFFNKKEEKRAKSQPTEIERLELYHCPHCHAGISSMSFVSGWIFGKGEKRSVKAVIKCNACQRRHALEGDSPMEMGVLLILSADAMCYADTRQATGEITGGKMPWICLKDQYPEAGKYYLFINRDHLPFVGFWKENYGATVDGELCRPTHWMPLPEPPVASNNRFKRTR